MSQKSDFATDFDGSLSTAFGALVKATKIAGKLPTDISFHRTLDETIDAKLERTSKRTLHMANKLWTKAKADPTSMAVDTPDDIAIRNDEGSWEMGPGFRPVVDAVDTLLERIDVGLDEVLKNPVHQMRTAASEKAAAVGKQSAPVVTTVAAAGGRKTDVRLVHAQNIPRPQLAFRDTIDNSPTTPFVWKIRNKVHAQVPLDYGLPGTDVAGTPMGSHLQSLGISRPVSPASTPGTATPREAQQGQRKSPKEQLDVVALMNAMTTAEPGSLTSLPHPYEYEIRHIDYPSQLFEVQEPHPPKEWDSTPFEFVDTVEKLQEMVEHLEATATEIAIDLEHHNYRSYQGFTCLAQISSRTRDFVVDALALRSDLHCLNQVTADPKRIKVFHGAESDIQWLQRDFGVYVVGLFDTYHASKVLNMEHHSLAYLLKTYVNFDADKKYQLADWRIRPIPAEMMKYARADTHFLLYVFDRMRNELLERGERLVGEDLSSPNAENFGALAGLDVITSAAQPMELTLRRSANTSLNKYEKDGYDVENGLGGSGWATLLKKWHHPFSPTQLAVYRALHRWRDSCAREEDESTRYVLPNHMLFAIADRMPEDAPALLAACQPTPPLVRLYASDIVMLINQERRAAESRIGEMKQLVEQAQAEQAQLTKPVHTRFDDESPSGDSKHGDMDVDNKAPSTADDVLTGDLLASVGDMIVPVSGLFGDSVAVPILPGTKSANERSDGEDASPEAVRARNKAQEIRTNLVLTVAVPKAVLTHGEEKMDVDEHAEHEFVIAERRKNAEKSYVSAESKKSDAAAANPVVLSETYGRYQPEHKAQAPAADADKKNAGDLELPKIALGDLVDSSGDEEEGAAPAKKRTKKSKSGRKGKGGSVRPEEVKPFSYTTAEDNDVIGKSTVTMDDSKKAKRAALKRDKKAKGRGRGNFDPYAQMGTSEELARRPNKSRVTARSGNRSMSFKK
ncbi:hypothetical protein GQ54DRAFT_295614 [Martensiomyces pterosporus]|nr:hypothetical protein GQ54DRAFT_295614 [Martensiomyces pterosporus]